MGSFAKIIVAAGLSVLSQTAFAQQIALTSGACGAAAFGTSTGTIVRVQNQIFVLASADHVLNSGDKSVCHQAKTADGKTYDLKLSRFDVAAGLALLSAPAELGAVALDVKPVGATLLMKVRWDGGAGRVSSAHSTRHHYTPAGEVLEVKGSPLSGNLTGQPVVNDKNELVGVIANQFVEEVPGQGARVRRMLDSTPVASSVLIVLPSARLATWLQSVLAPSWRPAFDVSAQDQQARVVRWSAGSLRWTQNCPPPDSQPRGGDFPIGGVDPFGIGGDSAGSPACLFTPELSGSSVGIVSRASWTSRIASRVQGGQTLTLRLGAQRRDGILSPLPAVSMGQFAQLLERADVDFVITRKDPPAETDATMAEFRLAARRAFAQAAAFPYGALPLRQRAYLATLISQTEDWRTVTVDDLQKLTDECYADQTMIIHIPDTLKELTAVRRRLP